MTIENSWPPDEMMHRIELRFPEVRARAAHITIGEICYNPHGERIQPSTFEHELVHSTRQLAYPGGVEAFIDRYFEDDGFRLDEEVLGYAAEVRYFVRTQPGSKNRMLARFANHLSSPLYSFDITMSQAYDLLERAL